MAKQRYQVNLVVEAFVLADSPHDAAEKAEQKVQRCLDLHAKRFDAVVGADYMDVNVAPREAKGL